MKLKIERVFLQQLKEAYLPEIIKVADIKLQWYETDQPEYWNARIIKEILLELMRDVEKKLVNTTGEFPVLKLNASQGYALYNTMLHFPIAAHLVWHNMKRDGLIAALNQFILNPDAGIIFNAK
jgi:hypothetical protein